MKKETPGEYKVPNYNPPKMDINTQEVLMVRELLLAGRQGTEIIKIMARELGINYYWDRFDRARALGEELTEEEYDQKKSCFPEKGSVLIERHLLEEEEEEKEKALKTTSNKNKEKPQTEEVKKEHAEITTQLKTGMPGEEGKQFMGQTVRQRRRNGKLTGVTVVKKFY